MTKPPDAAARPDAARQHPEPALTARRGVLVTRPEPGLSETMEALRALGWHPVAAPSLRVEARHIPHQDGLSAAVVTSGQAVTALAVSVPNATPVFAVGDATARRAEQAGFTHVLSAASDATDLVRLIKEQLSPASKPIILLSGAGQGVAVAAALRTLGFTVRRRVAYTAEPVQTLPASALTALRAGAVTSIMSFSARSAGATVSALRRDAIPLATLDGVAISENVAAVLRAAGLRRVVTAVRPNTDAMIAALRRLRDSDSVA